jgi:hypothetical protein
MTNRQRRSSRLTWLLCALLVSACATPLADGHQLEPTPRLPTFNGAAAPTPDSAPAIILPGSTATPAPSAAPPASPAPRQIASLVGLAVDPPAKAGRFKLDLYRPNAHVRQVGTWTCVGAAMQMMINLIEPGKPDRSRATQLELYDLARSHSPWIHIIDRDGASSTGWATGMTELGYGDWQVLELPTMADALRTAARQMRLTGKPVGLMVWSGRHSWLMSGFKATADPAWTDAFDVTAIWVEDSWYGRRDARWGRGHAPHSLLDTDYVSRFFVNRTFGREPLPGAPERYVIVVPLS